MRSELQLTACIVKYLLSPSSSHHPKVLPISEKSQLRKSSSVLSLVYIYLMAQILEWNTLSARLSSCHTLPPPLGDSPGPEHDGGQQLITMVNTITVTSRILANTARQMNRI